MAELTNNAKQPQGGHSRKSGLTPGKVDLTAMVDLAFLLITFFMLTTSMNQPNSLLLAMPDKSPPSEVMGVADDRTVNVILATGDKVLWYRGKPNAPMTPPEWTSQDADGIRDVLLKMKAQIARHTGKDMIVLVKPMADATTQTVISILDEMQILEVGRFMLTKPTSDDVRYVGL